MTFVAEKSYVEHEGALAFPASQQFNHGLGEIVAALLDAELRRVHLEEHRSAPSLILEGAMQENAGGEFQLRDGRDVLPLTYTLVAEKLL